MKLLIALSVIALVSVTVSCATASDAPTLPDMPVAEGKGYRLPPYQEKKLANGLTILFVPDQTLPYVSFSMLVKAGASQDPDELAGLASFVSELLDKGTAKRSAPQIAQELGQMGADFDSSTSLDYSIVNASGLAMQAEALLSNLFEIVTSPAFSDPEVERYRKQILAQIGRRIDSPEAFSGLAFEDFIYSGTPYGHPSSGTLKSVKEIKRKHIIQHYKRFFRPNNAILAVVGKYTPELVSKIESSFGSWEQREVSPQAFKSATPITGTQIRVIDKPGLVQAQIRLGHLGIKRKNEDFLALRMANTILGGAFASRLNNRIRKQLGLTYSISSHFDARQELGPFQISTFTKPTTIGQTVTEALKVLSEFKSSGPTKEELEAVRGYLKGVFPTAIETPEKLAFNLVLLRFYGIPDSYLTNYLADLDRISLRDVNSVIKKYFDEKNIKILVYASASDAVPQLEKISKVEIKKASELQ